MKPAEDFAEFAVSEVSTGIKIRRRRLRIVAGVLAGAAVLAIGVLALSRTSSPLSHNENGASSVAARTQAGRVATFPEMPSPGPGLVTPVVPAQHLAGRQVPITAKSVGLLLLDTLPAGTAARSVAATTNDIGMAAAQADIRNSQGTGSVVVQMWRTPVQAQCAPPRPAGRPGKMAEASTAILACENFVLPGDVRVHEELISVGRAAYIATATVQRPNGVTVMVEAANYTFDNSTFDGTGKSAAPALTMAEVVAAAGDPRWAWTMNRAFVRKAGHLHLTAAPPG